MSDLLYDLCHMRHISHIMIIDNSKWQEVVQSGPASNHNVSRKVEKYMYVYTTYTSTINNK